MRTIVLLLGMTLTTSVWAQSDHRQRLLDFTPTTQNDSAPTARGVVKAHREAVLAAQMDGRIVSSSVKPGETFKKGTVLIKQDCTIKEVAIRKARIELKAKQTQHKLNTELKKRRAISDTEVEISRLEVEAAKAEISGIRAEIERCSIRAPFNGWAIKLWSQTHETVKGGSEVLTVISDEALEFELFVPSIWLRWLKTGTEFGVIVDELAREFRARVISVGASVDAASQTIDIRARFLDAPRANNALLPGMSGSAVFANENR